MAEHRAEASPVVAAATPGAAAVSDQKEPVGEKAAAAAAPPAPVRLGPIMVRAGAAAVEAFRRETAGTASRGVPFTFPVCWFAHPEIRSAGAQLIGTDPWVPIHESQSFDYERMLDVEADYQMTVEILRELEPPRLILRAEIREVDGGSDICLRAEMILRIIPTRAAESLI